MGMVHSQWGYVSTEIHERLLAAKTIAEREEILHPKESIMSHDRITDIERDVARGIAARPQEILAGLDKIPCRFCGVIGDGVHKEGCSVLLAKEAMEKYIGEVMGEDVEGSKPENPEVVNHHLTDSELKRYCDNARAYGWEAGRLFAAADSVMNLPALQPIYNSHPSNPFVNPDWDRDLKIPQGFIVTAKDNQL